MKSEHDQMAASAQWSEQIAAGRSVDRRRFMESAAAVGIFAGLDVSLLGKAVAAQAGSKASTDSRLPDGTEFARWEQPLTFSKTYYVDNICLLYTSPSPRDRQKSRMPSSA